MRNVTHSGAMGSMRQPCIWGNHPDPGSMFRCTGLGWSPFRPSVQLGYSHTGSPIGIVITRESRVTERRSPLFPGLSLIGCTLGMTSPVRANTRESRPLCKKVRGCTDDARGPSCATGILPSPIIERRRTGSGLSGRRSHHEEVRIGAACRHRLWPAPCLHRPPSRPRSAVTPAMCVRIPVRVP